MMTSLFLKIKLNKTREKIVSHAWMMIILILEISLKIVIKINKGALIYIINKREPIICKIQIFSQKDSSNLYKTHLSIHSNKRN